MEASKLMVYYCLSRAGPMPCRHGHSGLHQPPYEASIRQSSGAVTEAIRARPGPPVVLMLQGSAQMDQPCG
eukprot:1742914-Pleurochrysis_carterae.AAC.1